MSDVAPFDRSVALACTMPTLRGRWLDVRCACGHVTRHPVLLMLRQKPEASSQTLADAVVRLRCAGCGGRALTVYLCETAHGSGPISGSVRRGWGLLLHDGAGQRGPAATREAAE